MHAWPDVSWGEIADARWAPGVLTRWEEVEELMQEYCKIGMTTSRDDVDLLANAAYRKARVDLMTGARMDRTRRN